MAIAFHEQRHADNLRIELLGELARQSNHLQREQKKEEKNKTTYTNTEHVQFALFLPWHIAWLMIISSSPWLLDYVVDSVFHGIALIFYFILISTSFFNVVYICIKYTTKYKTLDEFFLKIFPYSKLTCQFPPFFRSN